MRDIIIVELSHFSFPAGNINLFGFEYRNKDTIQEIEDFIDNPNFWKSTGEAFKKTLEGKPYFVLKTSSETVENFESEIFNFQKNFQFLNNYLWFSKDNSSNFFRLTAFWNNSMNYLMGSNAKNSNAQGLFIKQEFTYADFELAKKVLEANLKPNQNKESSTYYSGYDEGHLNMFYDNVNHKTLTRIDRAIDFVGSARSNRSLPAKIAYYVLVLETLFAAGTSAEISHKLCERIAIYIGGSLEERRLTFSKIQEYYNIRSRYIHGSAIDIQPTDLEKTSAELDSLIRKVLTKVILEDSATFLLTDKQLKNWFNDQVLT